MFELSWPRVLRPSGARLLSIQYFLERSERLSPKDFFRLQSQQLRQIIKGAVESCPFYQGRIPREIFTDMSRAVDHWRSIPLLTRRELQTNVAAITSSQVTTWKGPFNKVFTSGSSGTPVMVLSSPETRVAWSALTVREHLWHRRDPSGVLAVIRATPPGLAEPPGQRRPSWGSPVAEVMKTGPSFLLSIHSSIDRQIEFLNRCNPHYLLTYPSVMLELAKAAKSGDLSLPRLKQVRTFGELMTAAIRRSIEDGLRVKVADVYSAQEVGYIAIQCSESSLYHIQGENVLLEVLNDAGSHCRQGEVGRVVVTSLWNRATPLIRYDIGDFAEVGPPCSCGRSLPTLRRVIGRERNLLVLPDGRKTWPMPLADADAEATLAELPPIHQFQIVQRSLQQIEVRLVVPRSLTAAEQSKVRAHVRTMLGHPFKVDLTFLNEIPRGAGGKFEDFRNEMSGEVRP